MFTCYAKTIILGLALIVFYGISFLPLLLLRPYLQLDQFLVSALLWGVISLLSLPFFLRHLIRKVWFFKGRNESIPQGLMEDKLMKINTFNSPVYVRKKRKKILVGWRCKEPEWSERMAIEGLKKCYFIKLKFNQETRTVSMIDRVRYANFDLSPAKVQTSWLARPVLYCRVQFDSEQDYNIFNNKDAEEYLFKPQELKTPLVNTFINNGWNVRFDLF